MNLTDSTCYFGLAQLGGGCSTTFASLNEAAYLHAQIIYLVSGLVTVFVASFMFWRASRRDAIKLQQHSLLLCAYAALTFVFRSADPNSYKHVIPHPIVCYFSDSCTAALYTIFIMLLSHWASVIQHSAEELQRPLNLAKYVWAASIAVWVFYLVIDVCLVMTKGYFTPLMMNLQLMLSAGVLAIIGIAFVMYGIRVQRRVRHFERQRILFELRTNPYHYEAATSRFVIPDVSSSQIEASYSKKSGNSIIKIVSVVSAFVVVVVSAQIYIGTDRSSGPNLELNCANGLGCNDVKLSVSVLHWFQLVAIWGILCINRNIEEDTKSEATASVC